MSSYGSMSPSEEGYELERYDAFYCPPTHHGSPMETGGYWPTAPECHEFDTQEVYHHDTTHYIGRHYSYEDMQLAGNDPYDGYHHNFTYTQSNTDCTPRIRAPPFARVVKRRTTANKKERRRTQSINTAFCDLRECIPNVPQDTKLSKMVRKRSLSINAAFSLLRERIPNVLPDTKLSKIKTLRLATSYISYLLKVLESDAEPAGGFRADIQQQTPRRRNQEQINSEKRKGRTGWPQHVWALELKTEQSLHTNTT